MLPYAGPAVSGERGEDEFEAMTRAQLLAETRAMAHDIKVCAVCLCVCWGVCVWPAAVVLPLPYSLTHTHTHTLSLSPPSISTFG